MFPLFSTPRLFCSLVVTVPLSLDLPKIEPLSFPVRSLLSLLGMVTSVLRCVRSVRSPRSPRPMVLFSFLLPNLSFLPLLAENELLSSPRPLLLAGLVLSILSLVMLPLTASLGAALALSLPLLGRGA